jgi:hypothetical protein
MTIVLNSTTGISTPPVTVLGDTSGSISIVAPAVAGTNTQTLLAATGTLSPFNSGTAQTAPPTVPQYFEFTSIPSWVRRVTVMFRGISTNGTSPPQLQLGTSGGIVSTGYLGSNSIVTPSPASALFTSGFGIGVNTSNWSGAVVIHGTITLTLQTGNNWTCAGSVGRSDAASTYLTNGSLALSDTLTQIRITTVGGSDTFDAGSINLLYE